jgi:hypothetical protein
MKSRLLLSHMLLAALWMLPHSASAEVLPIAYIDTFDATQQFVSDSPFLPMIPTGSILAAPEALGGVRDLRVERLSGALGVSAGVSAASPGIFFYSSDVSTGGTGRTAYGGSMFDLTQHGANALLIRASSDLGAPIRIEVASGQNERSAATVLVPSGSAFAQFLVPFASFARLSANDADFTRIALIDVTVEGQHTPGVDVSIDYLATAVPEPSSLCLASIALGMGGAWAWRRRAAQRPVRC